MLKDYLLSSVSVLALMVRLPLFTAQSHSKVISGVYDVLPMRFLTHLNPAAQRAGDL